MGLSLGFIFEDDRSEDSLVLHHQLHHDRIVLIRYNHTLIHMIYKYISNYCMGNIYRCWHSNDEQYNEFLVLQQCPHGYVE